MKPDYSRQHSILLALETGLRHLGTEVASGNVPRHEIAERIQRAADGLARVRTDLIDSHNTTGDNTYAR